MIHLGEPNAGPLLEDVLTAAAQAGVERLVHTGSAAVYRGNGERVVTEESLVHEPEDPLAREWWHQEERCRQWAERSAIPVQVLRLADPVGPYAPAASPCAQWVHLAWTRRPLVLDPRAMHQVLDYRDMADAIHAVLSVPPTRPVFNVASATYSEEDLAGLLAEVSRRTPWERSQEQEPERWTMSTELIGTELGWRSSSSLHEGMRALAQWYACDIHGDYVVP
ncbi:NAD-dependent epimerase/dehydratase family protein [Streptomyces sp. NPDC054841]